MFEEKPWGRWDLLDTGLGFKVKRITVHPGHRLSLQLHNKRAENWIIVSGSAEVTIGEKKLTLSVGEHVFIPKETPHRLENKEKDELVVIEVAIGDYIKEDDIIRLADDYGR